MLYKLSELGLLQVSGPGAKKLLQGQLTCNLDEITANSHRLSALCNPQGRVISLFYIVEYQHSYLLLMPHNLLTITINTLKKYAIFYRTELQDVSDKFFIFGHCNQEIRHDSDITSYSFDNDAIEININDSFSRKIIINKQIIQNETIGDHDQWNYFNIISKIPTIYAETSGKFLPHEINLQHLNAISFDKGCYTGQEIISRMHYRGKLKNQLQVARYQIQSLNEIPAPGQAIYAMQDQTSAYECGLVVDVYHDRSYNVNLLIMIADEHTKNNHLIMNIDYKNNFLEMLATKHIIENINNHDHI